MSSNGPLPAKTPSQRSSPRVYSVREITVSYEGQNEEIRVKPPNLSKRGMFINTSCSFPEGAVLNLRFTLAMTGGEIRTRCEVRSCQPGSGIGVEFIGLDSESMKMIEREIALSAGRPHRTRPRGPRKKPNRIRLKPRKIPRGSKH
ncbi:MAG TPA: PilZ domain-containing protein [Candidatus Acidoferrum sp.]|jgi:hypothetical protein